MAAEEQGPGTGGPQGGQGEPSSPSHRSARAARIEKLERQRADPGSRYEVRGELGRGGMGLVYEVWDTDLRRALAMKVLRTDAGGRPGSSTSSENVVRFLEEAQITAQLDHPGIVPVHELSVDSEGRIYFTMGRVKGRSLKELVQALHAGSDDTTLTRAAGVILKVCETMAFAHQKGVVHRDLKPTNVMVGRFGAVYVMDWGLAAVKGMEAAAHDIRLRASPDVTISELRTDRSGAEEDEVDSPLVTLDGAVIGTPAYMSPEQARGEIEHVGPQSDVYSVGAMLYQVLTGRAPYVAPGMRVSARTLLAMVIHGPPEPVESLARVPAELVAICERAMGRRPEERYPGMQAFALDLQAYLEGRVVHAYETGAWAELKKWLARNRGLAASLAALLLLAFAGLALWTYTQGRHARELFLAADVYRYGYLVAQADELWPVAPGTAPRLRAWIGEVEELMARRDQHAARLDALRRAHLDAAGRAEAQASGVWDLGDAGAQASHDALVGLVQGLDRLAQADPEVSALADVRARLSEAETLERRSLGERAREWDEARAAIAELPAYGGLDLAPQLGLVPLGADPTSGLWEFAHVLSGAVPQRDGAGHLSVGEESGVVLVLIPGGAFKMGAEKPPTVYAGLRTGPNRDAHAHFYEGPVHEVALGPYFISKYELTQAQWRRLTHAVPSVYNPESEVADKLVAGRGWMHPVEEVSWEDCMRTLGHVGLILPTEAQWERAARGGTSTVYSSGDDRETLRGGVNIADRTAVDEGGAQWYEAEEWQDLDDGFMVHAPVDVFAPNPFGLYHVHDNVAEWCRDWFVKYGSDMGLPDPGDGYRSALSRDKQGSFKIVRGGSFRYGILEARSAYRQYRLPTFADQYIGVRPARAVQQ